MAALSAALLTRPVVVPAKLTEGDRRLAKTLPREVTVRLLAATFEFREAKGSLRPLVHIVRPDGTWRDQLGARYFVKVPIVR